MNEILLSKLKFPERVDGDKIFIQKLKPIHITKKYLSWMNSREINKYLESRFRRYTLSDLKKYYRAVSADKDCYFSGIFLKSRSNLHIGNIKLGPINRHHQHAKLGIMIGDKRHWGKGFATEAISLVTNMAFNLGVHRVYAGAYAENKGSIASFQKCGFSIEGIRKDHAILNGKFHDVVIMGRIFS